MTSELSLLMLPQHLPSPAARLQLQLWHIGLIHAPHGRGRIALARATADGGWDEGLIPNSRTALRKHLKLADVQFVSQLRFGLSRNSSSVEAITAAFLDLDFRGAGLPFAEHDIEEVIAIALDAIAAAGLPAPDWVTDSGNGIHLVWRFSGIGKKALPRWRRLMASLRGPRLDKDGNPRPRSGAAPDPRHDAWTARMLPLWRMLRDLGLDRGASDPARVLRVWGTINPKGGRMARCAWPASIQDIGYTDFDALCDSAMMMTRAELRIDREERKVWAEAHPEYLPIAKRPRKNRRAGTKWAMVLQDLFALRDSRGGIAVGKRMRWTLFCAIALSQTEGGDPRSWAERLAPLSGLPVAEVEMALSGVERGMLAHEAGETRDYDGVTRPAFYDYGVARMAHEMEVTDDEAEHLRILSQRDYTPKSAEERRADWRERQAASRVRRDPQRVARNACKAADLHSLVTAMVDAGYTVTGIARNLEIARSTVYEILRPVPDAEPVVEPAVVVEDAAASVRVRSPSIVVSDPQPAPRPAALPFERYQVCPARIVETPQGQVLERKFTESYAEYRNATACWSILRTRNDYPTRKFGRWSEERTELPYDHWDHAHRYTPAKRTEASDALFHEVLGLAAADVARDRRAMSGKARRRPATFRTGSRPTASLPPLDVRHEAKLYLAATQGS